MNEQQYIDATNLAKLRIAQTILRDVLMVSCNDEQDLKSVRDQLTIIIEPIEKRISTKDN